MLNQSSRQRPNITNLFLGTLLVATACKVWLGDSPGPAIATAQIPDSGLQRKVLIDEVRLTNQFLSQILDTVKTQTLKVRIEGTDKDTNAKRGSGS